MKFSCLLVVALTVMPALAHPVPDVPVRGVFKSKGQSIITVEVDPRCFVDDAENAPYINQRDLEGMSKQQRAELIAKARKLIQSTLQFRFDPEGALKPSFRYEFEERPNAAPDEVGGTPITIVATWKVKLPSQATKYQLVADKKGRFSVYFLNRIDGRNQKLRVLFPGEESYWLQLPSGADDEKAAKDQKGTPGQ